MGELEAHKFSTSLTLMLTSRNKIKLYYYNKAIMLHMLHALG